MTTALEEADVTEVLATPTPTLADLDAFRGELTGYCYRMLGSVFDADDAVQDTMVKAWQSIERFEGRSSLRSWLYRIATNTCLDALRSKQRRAVPMDLMAAQPATQEPGEVWGHEAWVEPLPTTADPAEAAVQQDSVRLAFVAALQHLPPKQRAVLIFREVLCWQASEVAELLDTTVASVNSALQRARATLGERPEVAPAEVADPELLARYVDAFQRYDIDSLVSLLHEDASISMPPYAMWLQGLDDLRGWYLGYGLGCKGSRLVPTVANGLPAFGQYRASGPNGEHEPWSLQVLEVVDGKVAHIHHFLDTSLFARFGLPATPPA